MDYAARNTTSTTVTNTFVRISYGTLRRRAGIQHRWKAVELFSGDNYSSKTDVWAFGVLLWEISTLGGEPYQGMSDADVIRKIQSGYRMPKPEHSTINIYNLMLSCWREAPNKRPTFSTIVKTLKRLLEKQHRSLLKDQNYVNINCDRK
ncbi:tyrosine-protein kinase receptor Tie-1-like [Saccoglossus kowalevskii]